MSNHRNLDTFLCTSFFRCPIDIVCSLCVAPPPLPFDPFGLSSKETPPPPPGGFPPPPRPPQISHVLGSRPPHVSQLLEPPPPPPGN